MSYQKTYMNNIHSSSLLYQLSTMWKTQTLCDAIIRTGNVITKAHRVVLVAACPMLQSMENAVAGSHLEVRLAADIKQDSINSFLQYLYEGFMTLTEDNCKDVEKIARLLQVENVTKCCADFSKCINASTSQYRYNYPDQLDYKHVRTTDLLKVQDRLPKRHTDGGRPPSPGSKRPRIQRQSSPSLDMSRSHDMPGMSSNEPWDRVPRLGSHSSSSSSVHIPSQQPGVVDIVEDSIQLIQTEPPTKRPGDDPSREPRKVQTSVGVSVASQHNAPADVQIVSVPNSVETSSQKGANDSSVHIPSTSSSSEITHKDSGPKPPFGGTNFPQKVEPDKHVNNVEVPNLSHPMDVTSTTRSRPPEIVAGSQPQKGSPYPVSITASSRAVPQSFPQKPYAAGSAMQAESMQSGAQPIRGPKPPPLGSRPESLERASPMEKPPDIGAKQMEDSGAMSPDISIVKVENEVGPEETGLLDMYVSEAGGNETGQGGHDLHGREEEESDFDLEEPPGEWQKDDMSNESGNMSMDQSGNWYMSNFRGGKETSDARGQAEKNLSKTLDKDGEVKSLQEIVFAGQQQQRLMGTTFTSPAQFTHQIGINGHEYICNVCGKHLRSKYGCQLHREKYHTNQEHLPKCTICLKKFPSEGHLATHLVSHSDERNYSCQVCKKSYKMKHHLKMHIKRAHFVTPP